MKRQVHYHFEGIGRAITRSAILSAAVASSYFLHDPRFLYLIGLCIFTRAPKAPRLTMQQQLNEVNARLDDLAHDIARINKP